MPRQAASCARLHKPTAEDLLDLVRRSQRHHIRLQAASPTVAGCVTYGCNAITYGCSLNHLWLQVRRSQPAVLTGLLEGWPALHRWDYAYLRRHLGAKPVTVSVAEGLYDVPEDPAIWGVGDRSLSSVVARPAHETMRFAEALSHFESSSSREIAPVASAVKGLRYYLEYFPMEAMRTGRLRNDLRRNVSATTDVCEAHGLDSDSEPAAGQPASITATSEPEPEFQPEPEPEPDVDALPTLSTDGEPGELAIADWLLPRKHLMWLGGGGTVGATHYDPYENLMAVIAGSKTFHLASPDDGHKIGAFTPMAEGTFELHPGTAGRPPTLGRSAAKVTQATSLHHYASAVLSQPAQQQPALPRMAEATIFSCTAQAGEVLYVPSYWWHEVHSSPGAADRPSIGINWFYESYYQRIFPNQSWDRSLHYLMLNAPSGNALRTPFPPHDAAASGGARGAARSAAPPHTPEAHGRLHGASAASQRADRRTTQPVQPVQPVPPEPSEPTLPPASRARTGRPASFAERLQQRAAAQRQGAQGS